ASSCPAVAPVRGRFPALAPAERDADEVDAGAWEGTLARGRLCDTVETPVGLDDEDEEDVGEDVDEDAAGGPIAWALSLSWEEPAAVASLFCGVAVPVAREGRTTFMRRPEPARRSSRNDAPSKMS